MSMQRDLELLYEIGCLRFIQRSWHQFLNSHSANLADHHFRVVWIALLIAKHEGAGDHEKIMKMALVHDLGESRTGDLHYVSRQYSERNEDLAIDDIFHDTAIGEEIAAIWHEYEKKECIEAKIVKDADNLDVDLELQEMEAVGSTLKKSFEPTRKAVLDRLYTETAKKLWHEIQGSNPHDWHLHARNRLNSGDWKK